MKYRAYLFKECKPVGLISAGGEVLDSVELEGDGRQELNKWKLTAEQIFFEEREWENKDSYFIELEKMDEKI